MAAVRHHKNQFGESLSNKYVEDSQKAFSSHPNMSQIHSLTTYKLTNFKLYYSHNTKTYHSLLQWKVTSQVSQGPTTEVSPELVSPDGNTSIQLSPSPYISMLWLSPAVELGLHGNALQGAGEAL